MVEHSYEGVIVSSIFLMFQDALDVSDDSRQWELGRNMQQENGQFRIRLRRGSFPKGQCYLRVRNLELGYRDVFFFISIKNSAK